MGRRPLSNKRKPADYPLFSFRTSTEIKDQMGIAVEQVQRKLNKHRNEGEPFINKNDVIVMALEIGLAALKKR
jgi:hypothetical protein